MIKSSVNMNVYKVLMTLNYSIPEKCFKVVCALQSESLEKTSPNLDSIALSEMDKAAVLTLIREEVSLKKSL